MAKRNVTKAKRYLAKVVGEKKWMALTGKEFYITEDKTKALDFSADYVEKIVASNWGGKKWEKVVHNG